MSKDSPLVADAQKCWKCNGSGLKPVKTKLQSSRPACSVCSGTVTLAHTPRTRPPKPYRPFKEPSDWKPQGPPAAFNMFDPRMAPGEGEMLCSLSGSWMIYQLENGHRMTSDDLLIAYIVIQHYVDLPIPTAYLDIGTGLGSVLNLVNWAFHGNIQKSIGIEAQSIHVELARKTLRINGIDSTTAIIHHDLRSLIDGTHAADFPDSEKFGLITGTPPYFPAANGSLPCNAGRGMCAFELRGGIEVYCRMARRHLLECDTSRFVVTQTSLETERTIHAARAEGFVLLEQWDIHGIKGKLALFSVFVFKLAGFGQDSRDESTVEPITRHLYIRGEDGQFTKEMDSVFLATGKPLPKFEPQCVPKHIK